MNIRKNTPNLITVSRIPLLLAGLYLLHLKMSVGILPLVLWFLTDIFDGWLARKLGAESNFGKYADHIIDGVTLLIAYSYLIFFQPASMLIKGMIIILILRILVVAFASFKINQITGSAKPSWLGKFGSAFQMVAVIYYFAFPELFLVVFIPGFFLVLISGGGYLRDFFRLIQKESLV